MQSGRQFAETGWEHFHHEADIGIRGWGPDLASAFEQAALAMTAVICNPHEIRLATTIRIECEAVDDEFLLVNWIDALVYQMATRSMLFGHFQVGISDGHLVAEVSGEPIDVHRHQPAVEIKGATLTALRVYRDRVGRQVAECIVDV